MKKKLVNFLIVITVSTIVVSGLISPQLADEDYPDLGDMNPLIINEYV